MDFQDLGAFVHVARQQSFSKAAAELRVAQSALSRRVRRLEHELGVQLLARHARGARLTEAGMVLANRAEGLMQDLDVIERDLLSLAREPTGHVRIAFPPTTGQVLAPLVLAACRQRFPKISCQLREGFSGAIHEWLVNGQIDIALLYDPEASSELRITPILDEPLYLIAPTTLKPDEAPWKSKRDKSDIPVFKSTRLSELPLILPTRLHSVRRLVERFAANHGFQLQIVNEVDGTTILGGLVRANLGYTIFSYAGVHEAVMAGALQIVSLSPPLTWRLALVDKKLNTPSIAVSVVRNIIEEQIHVLSENGFWHGKLRHAPKVPIGRPLIGK